MNPEFSAWFTKQFLDWEYKSKKHQTISDFAKYLNVPQSQVSSWMNGKYIPGRKNIVKLAKKLGPDIYQILKLKEDDPGIISIASLPDETQLRIKNAIQEITDEINNQNLNPNSSEAENLVQYIFQKHGFQSLQKYSK
jgi:transcriptional regulator with XRE-family HTH domain